VTALRSWLRRHRRLALDASIFIYELEANPRYIDLTDLVFEWLERPGRAAVTSTVTMTELLVQPYKEHDQSRVAQFFALLSSYPNLEWIAPDLEIADTAARLRALHRLRTPDAILAATAIRGAATGFVTNDAAFTRVESFETLLLDSLLDQR